ncbi:FtsK/SpoIIIE domain-containing protein [Actinomyces haliotis]|uniref:FtsK/SpoIIIE domain-containing protein n=1 Tax=Actinomyces haliotis TaxID=1280843 RepID=UPI002B26FE8B|nr:FtsK/SpoIIIE domain-containing protein [Actinomyces haliotis]
MPLLFPERTDVPASPTQRACASRVPPPSPAQAAREALTTAHHLAVLEGPDTGLVVPVPDGAVIGRGDVLTDAALSRRQLRTRLRGGRVLVSDPGSRNGTVLLRGARSRRRLTSVPVMMRPGDRLRAGSTVLELRPRPTGLDVPVPPSRRAARWMVLVPVVAVLAMAGVAVVGVVTGSRGLLGSLMVVPMLLMALTRLVPALDGRERGARAATGWRGRGRREPDPSSMLLAVAARSGRVTPDDTRTQSGEPVRAWAGRRRRRSVLAVEPGDAVALRGRGAVRALAWWTAQVAARGAVGLSTAEDGLLLHWGQAGGSATVVAVEPGAPSARAGSGGDDALVLSARAPSAEPEAAAVRASTRGLGVGRSDGVRARRLPAPLAPLVRSELPAAAGRVLDLDDDVPLTDRWMGTVLGLAPAGPPTATSGPEIPGSVLLSDVTGEIDRERVSLAWSGQRGDRLPAVLGVREDGAAAADLVLDGPHALLAGTTGSGKSELLTSWVLQLCLAQPPETLALVLVDYKGGAAFDPLRGLPHVAGVLTDLDPAGTWRALSSLRAEVRRRERVLARAGVKEVSALPTVNRLPRLVVLVDEFATLASEHPDVLDALVRVAAQGRSLGIHLVLATQRPQGAVTPSIRANTTLRVCLRVLDPADSRDVLGHEDAARLDRVPGRVLVAGAGDGAPRPAQAPWAGREQDVALAVREIAAAARGRARPFRPWAEPLPAVVRRPAAPSGIRRGPVLLALTDLPEEQRLGRWSWDPSAPLLVLGSSRSGRSSALESAAQGAALRGRVPQLCGAAWESLGAAAWTPGTVAGPRDPRRLARLWRLALDGVLAGDLLVLDDAESLVVAVDEQLGPGEGQAMLDALVRTLPSLATGLVVSASLGAATTRWASRLPTRLVLGAPEAAQASVAGLPRGVTTSRRPGAGVLLDGSGATACQVVLPGRGERLLGDLCGAAPLRLEPLPLTAPPTTGAWALGGDDATPLPAPTGSVLVVGPRGSGRSTTLAALARARRETGQPEALVLDDLDLAPSQEQARAEEALVAGRAVLASATTERSAGTYRGPLAVLRERADLVVLRPGSGPATQVAGTSLRAVVDARAPTTPGRGALLSHGLTAPVQVTHG